MIEINLILTNKLGLHARPASDFTKLATGFKSKITLMAKGKTVDAKSILMVLTMGIRQGELLSITAEGPDEVECIEVLKKFIEKLD
jgi:phosphocarrier protein